MIDIFGLSIKHYSSFSKDDLSGSIARKALLISFRLLSYEDPVA
jgi:hypothetical protein